MIVRRAQRRNKAPRAWFSTIANVTDVADPEDEMTRSTLSLFKNGKTRPVVGRRINDDPMAGLTPVERAFVKRVEAAKS
jgi:hypothetical protein